MHRSSRPHLSRLLLATTLSLAPACGTSDRPNTDAGSTPGLDAGPTTADSGAPGAGFRRIPLPGLDERVTGVHCTSPRACVLTADPVTGAGHVYATDGHTVTATLVTGDSALAASLGTLGTLSFLGLSPLEDGRLMARVRGQEAAFVTASGDPTQPSSWTAVRLGTAAGAELGLNAQFALVSAGGEWLLASQGRLLTTTDAPAPGATWTVRWSPAATPSVPSDIDAQRAADPTLCNSDPSVAIVPALLEPVHVAPDLSLLVAPAGAVGQGGSDTPGVCISTDGGAHFHHAAFAGLEQGSGPVGVRCTSRDHCVAFGGVESRPDSVAVFVTDDASSGAGSTWSRAATPALDAEARLRGVAFADDGVHGWLVGAAGPATPLLLRTVDGGHTWADATNGIRALAPDVRLHSVYVLDTTHVWIGGEHDVLLTSGD